MLCRAIQHTVDDLVERATVAEVVGTGNGGTADLCPRALTRKSIDTDLDILGNDQTQIKKVKDSFMAMTQSVCIRKIFKMLIVFSYHAYHSSKQ